MTSVDFDLFDLSWLPMINHQQRSPQRILEEIGNLVRLEPWRPWIILDRHEILVCLSGGQMRFGHACRSIKSVVYSALGEHGRTAVVLRSGTGFECVKDLPPAMTRMRLTPRRSSLRGKEDLCQKGQRHELGREGTRLGLRRLGQGLY